MNTSLALVPVTTGGSEVLPDTCTQHSRYRCGLCGRESHRKDTLSRHMQIHDRRRNPLKPRRKACMQCSKGKIRCSNEHPSCSSCVKRHITCVYGTQHKPSQPRSASDGSVQGGSVEGGSVEGGSIQGSADSASNTIHVHSARDMGIGGLFSQANDVSANSPSAGKGMSTPLASSTENYFPGYFQDQDFLANSASQDFEAATNFDWVFDGSALSPLDEAQFLQEADFNISQPIEIPELKDISSSIRGQPGTEVLYPGNYWRNGDIPTPEPFDVPSPEDPWPIDFHAGPAERLVLPDLDNTANRLSQKHFPTLMRLSSEDEKTLKRSAQLPSEQSLWPMVDVDTFPNKETIDHCLDLYFAHIHPMQPIIHRPTFDPGESIVVTLAAASLGANFVDSKNAQAFSNSLSELSRRLLLFMSERNRSFVRTEAYLTGLLLQCMHGYCSGNERLFELSETCRSSMIHCAKCMGLFHDVNPLSRRTSSVEDSWREWIRQERLRRLGWAVYEHDTSIAFLHNGRPHLNIGDSTLAMPCSMEHWDAPSAYAWDALHPRSSNLSTSNQLRPMIKTLLEDNHVNDDMINNERHRLIIIHTLSRMLWSLKELRSSPLIYSVPGGLEDVGQRVVNLLDRFTQHPTTLIHTYTRKEIARVVHTTHLIHITHLYTAGDLMNLFFPFLRKVLLRRTVENTNIISRLIQWAEADPSRVRTVAYHCAQLLALTRQFTENLTLEPFHVFYAGVLLMIMARLMPVVQDDQLRSAALNIDHLGSPDDPTSIKIFDWVRDGGDAVIGVHGVPVLCSETGRRQILEETIEMLKRMKIWGISQNLLSVVLKIRNEDLQVDWHKFDSTHVAMTC